MAKTKTNIDYLKESLTHTSEWLDGVLKDHQKEIDAMQARLDEAEGDKDRIEALEEEVGELEDQKFNGTEIDCGIGTIRYEATGSLDIQLLMEALAEVIKEQGVKGVLDTLREVYAV